MEKFKDITIFGVSLSVGDNGTIKNNKTGKIIKQSIVGGYCSINIPSKPIRKRMYVHRLVAIAHIEYFGDYSELTVNHKDYNKLNNNVENLEWMSRGDNIRYSFNEYHGNFGEKHYLSKLTKEDVLKIREMSKYYSDLELSKIFNVSKTSIYDIRKKRTWKYV